MRQSTREGHSRHHPLALLFLHLPSSLLIIFDYCIVYVVSSFRLQHNRVIWTSPGLSLTCGPHRGRLISAPVTSLATSRRLALIPDSHSCIYFCVCVYSCFLCRVPSHIVVELLLYSLSCLIGARFRYYVVLLFLSLIT